MGRENVKEHFSHYERPRILRVLVKDGHAYRLMLKERAESRGIFAREEEDVQFVLSHWQLILAESRFEPHEEVVHLEDCEKNIAWLETLLAVARKDKEVNT